MRSVLIVILLLTLPPSSMTALQDNHDPQFSGTSALSYLTDQCDFGPRSPGSNNLSLCRQYIVDTLDTHGWQITLQNFTYREVDCVNIRAWYNTEDNATLILGAHYDTRPLADQDPDSAKRSEPVMGANDGASGTAALLELSRILPTESRSNVELVFFDAEDSGGIDGWSWIVGSTHYVDQLEADRISNISSMILLDMIGDAELVLLRETSSTRSLQDSVWSLASDMGHSDIFVDTLGAGILDDHRPFLEADIPSLDIIHHNPFPSSWHTTDDTPDRCSAESLQIVGEVIETFIVTNTGFTTPISPEPPFLYSFAAVVGVLIVALVSYFWYRKK